MESNDYAIKLPNIVKGIYKNNLKDNPQLTTILNSGDKKVPHFSEVIGETFGMFYTPSLCKQVEKPAAELEWAVKAIDSMKGNFKYQQLIKTTSGSVLRSLMATFKFAEALEKKLPELPEEEDIKDSSDKLENLRDECKDLIQELKQAAESNKQVISDLLNQKRTEGKALVQEITQKIDANLNKAQITKAINQAIDEAIKQDSLVNDAIAALGWSEGENTPEPGNGASLTGTDTIPDGDNLQDKFEIIAKISKNSHLLKIIQEAGRFKKLISKIKEKSVETGDFRRRAIDYGRDISKIVDEDLMMLGHPGLKPMFVNKLINYQMRQHSEVFSTSLQKGNVMLFVDYSSSTAGSKNVWISAITWAIASAVSSQGRRVSIVLFNHFVDPNDIWHFKPGECTDKKLLNIINKDSHGGTCWENALDKGIYWIKANDKQRSKFYKGKIKNKKSYDFLLITDGENQWTKQKNEWIKNFHQFKQDYGVSLYGILVKDSAASMSMIANEIIDIKTLSSDKEAERIMEVALKS